MKLFTCLALLALVSGCTGIPEHVKPVTPFDIERYMGKWYEIARLDHSFERGLSQVTAEYTLQLDGTVKVTNSGYSEKDDEYRRARGTAKFARQSGEGYLKVSFFGPFYGSYVIFELDQKGYQYAFVSGFNRGYLWFLSRTPEISQELKERFIQQSDKLGFDTDQLIWVKQ
ncbi:MULTISPECIES: lipocalin family protein [unclassified Endozoicomonas]|uniref:lipocalin family protein n=1 Tax=unclassified Endozoicomonas TaxID=2644528 RepID=UPI0021491DB4|nr:MULTISPECIES: lipocalin family protein [unclassified Endozoicomonas]